MKMVLLLMFDEDDEEMKMVGEESRPEARRRGDHPGYGDGGRWREREREGER